MLFKYKNNYKNGEQNVTMNNKIKIFLKSDHLSVLKNFEYVETR